MDIASREDIHQIISQFYKKLIKDEQLYPFFEEIVNRHHLSEHLELVTDFWEDILFGSHQYKNNPMQIHLNVHAQQKHFTKDHFEKWLFYFKQTIEANFFGEKSEEVKNRALSIATVMQVKMNLYKT